MLITLYSEVSKDNINIRKNVLHRNVSAKQIIVLIPIHHYGNKFN